MRVDAGRCRWAQSYLVAEPGSECPGIHAFASQPQLEPDFHAVGVGKGMCPFIMRKRPIENGLLAKKQKQNETEQKPPNNEGT